MIVAIGSKPIAIRRYKPTEGAGFCAQIDYQNRFERRTDTLARCVVHLAMICQQVHNVAISQSPPPRG